MKQWFITSIADVLLTTGQKQIKRELKKQEGSLDYFILSQWFHIFILFFYNMFCFVSSNGKGKTNGIMIILACSSGIVSGISNIVYFHQRETNYFNYYNVNIFFVMLLEFMLTNSYNVMSIGGSLLIVLGSLLIDGSDYDKWFINKGYWKNLDTRLLLHENIINMNSNEDSNNLEQGLLYQETHRTYTKQHLMVIPIFLTNISDLLIKYSYHGFYTPPHSQTTHVSLINVTNTTLLDVTTVSYDIVLQGTFYYILFKQVVYVSFMNLNKISYDGKLAHLNIFYYNAGITLINSLIYYYVVIASPNIGYGKAILLTHKVFKCLTERETNNNDARIMGSLFIFCGSVAMFPNFILF